MKKSLSHYIPESVLNEVISVLAWGEPRYGDGWKNEFQAVHEDHAYKHIVDSIAGFKKDKETGYSNLAHAICRCMFALAKEKGVENEAN
jgi:hypothetical protein